MSWSDTIPFETLKGLTFVAIEVDEPDDDPQKIRFTADDGRVFEMYHDQDCCESVRIEEVIGDVNDLIGSPIVEAEEVSEGNETGPFERTLGEPDDNYEDSWTWTFYKLRTAKGYVTIRWLGESNGWYGEGVDLHLAKPSDG